ncbi:unnamed protein product [Periconia digitata]|uniref:Uncharacterized protein n=1 Tax=Periconia digitata TaxID=1303443 RepID=A0A9W4UIC1_9PLEO|nr:unnamed protein product [Periconia digitata]
MQQQTVLDIQLPPSRASLSPHDLDLSEISPSLIKLPTLTLTLILTENKNNNNIVVICYPYNIYVITEIRRIQVSKQRVILKC